MSASSGGWQTTPATPGNNGVSNEQFLQQIFGDQWQRALIAGFAGDPRSAAEANWTAFPAHRLPGLDVQARLNMYFCPSLVRRTRRVLAEFVSFHVIVVDDYGTKVPIGRAEKVLGTKPAYVIETSPGNYQAGWACEAITDLAFVRALLKKLHALIEADNLADPMIWRRLPVGINGKPSAKGWATDLVVPRDWLGGAGPGDQP